MYFKIASDGYYFAVPLLVLFVLFLLLGWRCLATISIVLSLFVVYFFRDPDRVADPDKSLIVSPADGKVIKIDDDYKSEYYPDGAVSVSIFLSIFNVHVQRIPIDGKVEFKKYYEGKFLAAWDDKASFDNEQSMIGIRTDIGLVMVKQIAGLVARRIKTYVNVGDGISKGDRLGLIKFGSRVDIIFPKGSVNLDIKEGDKLSGGKSVIARVI